MKRLMLLIIVSCGGNVFVAGQSEQIDDPVVDAGNESTTDAAFDACIDAQIDVQTDSSPPYDADAGSIVDAAHDAQDSGCSTTELQSVCDGFISFYGPDDWCSMVGTPSSATPSVRATPSQCATDCTYSCECLIQNVPGLDTYDSGVVCQSLDGGGIVIFYP